MDKLLKILFVIGVSMYVILLALTDFLVLYDLETGMNISLLANVKNIVVPIGIFIATTFVSMIACIIFHDPKQLESKGLGLMILLIAVALSIAPFIQMLTNGIPLHELTKSDFLTLVNGLAGILLGFVSFSYRRLRG